PFHIILELVAGAFIILQGDIGLFKVCIFPVYCAIFPVYRRIIGPGNIAGGFLTGDWINTIGYFAGSIDRITAEGQGGILAQVPNKFAVELFCIIVGII
ncbi:MAG: hypothetical protein AAGU23_04475, partial [Bacillota bacterium]